VEDVTAQRLLDVYAPEVVRLGSFRDVDDVVDMVNEEP
jgi:hypothetical protein